MELEDKNLVKHLDQEGQQWTRVIIAAEEEDTHSSSPEFVLLLLLEHLRSLRRSDSLQVHLGTVQCLPSKHCHHHCQLLRETSRGRDDRE